MSQDKFWLQFNNGKKEQLNDTKHGVRKEQIDSKYHNLFDGYDTNNDGTLEKKELETIKEHFKNFAGDNTLNQDENLKAKSVFADKAGIDDVDFMGFVKSVSDATAEIISSEEKFTRDGGKEITTHYKNGTTETIAYYKNGDFKWKKTKENFSQTKYEIIINGKRKELSEDEYKKALEQYAKKQKTSQGQNQRTYNDALTGSCSFPSEEVLNINSNTTTEEKYREEYSPRFVAENLGIDIQSEEGLKIIERLAYIPQDAFREIKDGSEIKELLSQNDLSPTFDNISNILELVYGITLRDKEELEATKTQREQLIAQIQTVEIMSELYAAVAKYNDDYTDAQGLFGMGTEGIGWLLNKLGIDGENHYQWADSCREFIKKINNFKVLNPEKFNKEFKELTGTSEFNTDALKKMLNLAKDGKAQDEDGNYTEEYKEAVKAFSNFDISNPNAKEWYHPDVLMSGFGEALIMIGTLGWAAEAQAGKTLAMTTFSTFSRLGVQVASTQVRNKLLQGALRLSGKGIKLIGPALNEGTKLYLYSAASGTATNIANRGIKFDSEENSFEKLLQTEGLVLDGATSSFGFGAFAGVFGSTATQKTMQLASRVSKKVGTALTDKLAAGSVDAADVYLTILEKSMPTKIAECAAFATDVLGFTAFESALALYHAVNNEKKYPNGISAKEFTDILWEEFKGQGVNLGQIKGVSYLIMFLTGSRSARLQASKYMRENLPQLKGCSVEQAGNGYKIKLPHGKIIECKNTNEMISSLHLMVRGETAFSKKFDIKKTQSEIKVDRNKSAETNIPIEEKAINFETIEEDLAEIEQRLDDILADIKDERVKSYAKAEIERFKNIRAPQVILLNVYKTVIRHSKNYISLMQKIGDIKDENLKKDVVAKIDEILNDSEEYKFSARFHLIENYCDNTLKTPSERFMDFIKTYREDIYNELIKNPEDIENPKYKEIKQEFKKYDKSYAVIEECLNNPNSEKAEEAYLKYLEEDKLSDNPKISEQLKKICIQINKDLGVKIFLPSNLKEAGVSLKIVYEELMSFKMHAEAAGEKANLPYVLNFMRIDKEYIPSSAGENQTTGHYRYDTNYMGVDGLTIQRVRSIILHEMTHANDTEIFYEFNKRFKPEKYISEFLAAGIDIGHITYAFNSPREFIAVAAEGDIRKYSAGFKEQLVKLGMPKWMLTMQNPTAEKNIITDPLKQLFAELIVIKRYEEEKTQKAQEEALDFDKDYNKESPDESKRGIPPEKIQQLIEKANGNQNVIKNLQKLIAAGANYGLCSDIVHRLDVPEYIVDTYLQKFQDTENGISYHLFTLINNLQDGSGLKSNYKEIFDYSLELFNRTSNGKKLTASQVSELIRYSRNDKPTIELMLQYMNIDELGNNQLKPEYIADLLPYIKDGNAEIQSRIVKIAKLSPEQSAGRDNKPLDGKVIKQILDIEGLTDEQLELIKSVLCDKNLNNMTNRGVSDYWKIECVKQLGYDRHSVELFKILISADLHPVNTFSKKVLNYTDVCKIVQRYPNKEDILTIKQLFELKADNSKGQRLKEEDFTSKRISEEELARMRNYMEAVKDNESLMNNLSFKIVNDEKRVQKILDMLHNDPNLTYDKVVMEVDILPKIEHIKNKELYNLALEIEKRGIKHTSDLIREISYKIENVEDDYLNDAINNLLTEVNTYLKNGSAQYDFILPIIDEWLDVYHTLKGDYEYIGTKADPTFKRAFYEFVKTNKPERAKELDRAIQEGKFDTNNPIWEQTLHDFAKEAGIDRLRNFFKNHPHEEMGEYLYKKYYLPTLPAELQEKCENIYTKYKTNIFLTHTEDIEYAGKVLDFVEKEFKEWAEKSNGTAVFPPVLDFSRAKSSFFDETSAYGESASAGFAENGTNNSISLDGYENAIYALRHEMAHLNDTKKGMSIDIQYDINEIMPKIKDENGEEKIDFKNCKYKEEFLRAGIPPEGIKYAYNNIEEFIAVAAEGDMSMYSESFKKILVNFGMPKWMLNMKQTNPSVQMRVIKTNYLIEFSKLYSLESSDGKEIDVSKEPEIFAELLAEFERCEKLSEIAAKEFRKYNVPDDPTTLFEYCFTREDKEEIYSNLGRIKEILLSGQRGEKPEVLHTKNSKSYSELRKEIEKDIERWEKLYKESHSEEISQNEKDNRQNFEEQKAKEKLPNYRTPRTSSGNVNDDLNFERNLPMSYEDIERCMQIITDERLKAVAEEINNQEQFSKALFDYISDIDAGLKLITDEKVLKYINDKLQKLQNLDYSADSFENIDTETEFFDTLGDIATIVDVYNTMNGNYSRYKKATSLLNSLYLDDKPITAEWVEHLRSTDPEGFEELMWEISHNSLGFQSADFLKGQRTESLATLTSNKEMLDYMYKNHYLSKIEDAGVRTELLDISEKYGVRILLSENTRDLKKTLSAIKDELESWQDISDGKAVLPPILDLNYCDIEYDKYGAAAYVTPEGNIGHHGGDHRDILKFLRHEIMHLNDPNLRIDSSADSEFVDLVRSIMPSKTIKRNGKDVTVLDYENCKYREELLKIGITPEHIKYAYTNLKEFLAVCAEGDLGRCSPEFKKLLLKLGMPEFVFNLPVSSPYIKSNLSNYDRVKIKYPEKTEFNELTQEIDNLNNRSARLERQLLDLVFGNLSLEELSDSKPNTFRTEQDYSELFKNLSPEKILEATGKEALESLLKVKEEVDKIFEKIEKDHNDFSKNEHGLTETLDESKKFWDTKNAYTNYKKAIDTAIELAQRIKYEESQSKVEKEFNTIEKTKAQEIIKNALKTYNEHYDWYADMLTEACTIEDKVSEELVNRTIELLKKDASDTYKIREFIRLFKSKSGIDRAAIELYEELSSNEFKGKDGSLTKLLESCKDEDSKFRFDYYEKAKQITNSKNGYDWINDILTDCKKIYVTADCSHSYLYIDESIWQKAIELKEMGFEPYEIHTLLEFCRNTSNDNYIISNEFSSERFELIKDLKDKYKVNLENISSILHECCNKEGEFNKTAYEAAIALKSHVCDEDIADYIKYYLKIEDKDAALKHIDELQQTYSVKSRRVLYLYKECCDKIEDSDNNTTTYKFNPEKYKKAVELKENYNVDDFDLQQYIKTCTVKGKFEEKIYNKIVEYKEKYGFEDETLNRLIDECIHPEPGKHRWEHNIIDYKLIDKIGVWTDIYLKQIDGAAKILNSEPQYNFRQIGHEFASILENIESTDCKATDYIENFLEAGITNIQTRLHEARILDENGYVTDPVQYNTAVMDAMVEWATKYNFDSSDQYEVIMNLINRQKNLSKEDAIKYVNQLFDAGWNPKVVQPFRAILEHWGQQGSREFDMEAINLFTEKLNQGFHPSVIEQAIYSCSQKGKPQSEEFYKLDREQFDKLMEMIKNCPDDKQFDAAGWMQYFTDYSESIIDVLKNNKVSFEDYYDFVRMELCSTNVMNNPEKKAQIPLILEQIRLHPESFNDIKEIFTARNGFPHDDKYFNFCFRHLKNSEWKKCFEQCKKLDDYRSSNKGLLLDVLEILDTDELPLIDDTNNHNIARYAFATVVNLVRYESDGINKGQYCPEVIEKIKEYMISGELAIILRTTVGSTIVFDNTDFCKVLDALAKAEREGLDENLIYSAFNKIRGGSGARHNYFAQNYQEIIDFYVRNIDILDHTDARKKIEDIEKNTQIVNLIDNIETDDVELLERTLHYARQFNNPSLLSTIGRHIALETDGERFINLKIDIKPIIEFLDKVDLDKYKDQVETLFEEMADAKYIGGNGNYKARNNLFSSQLSKESIEFILDTEKFLDENFERQKTENDYLSMPGANTKPQLTNEFFRLFLNGEVPEEALNKLRYYLEYQTSMACDENDIVFRVVDTGELHGSKVDFDKILKLSYIYKLRPDKIEFFEKYLFDGVDEHSYFINSIVSSLSRDKEILDKQLELLDDIMSYENAMSSRYRINEVFDSGNAKNINAQKEVWDAIKPDKNKKLKKGELSKILYTVSYTNESNKDIIKVAFKQKRFDGDADVTNLANNIRETNKDLILELLNDEKYSADFLIKLATYTYSQQQVDMAKMFIKDGTFDEDTMLNILNAVNKRNVPLAKEICFNKELNFPQDKIFDILWSLTDSNETLAWRLCTSKVRQIPADKIPLAIRCYRNSEVNPDMYINKFKMFLDLQFSDNFIQSILGTSGSLARYTKNFCSVLQHLQQKGAKAENCVEILTTDSISKNITENIDALEILNMINGDDIKLLQADGIDIYKKIQRLEKAIDVKHPIIDVQKGDEVGTLKVLANNGQADEVIRTMDLTQFESTNGKPGGIPLQYTREEFMQNMNHLITEYNSGRNSQIRELENVEHQEVPDLELSEASQARVAQKIEEFRQNYKYNSNDEYIIIDGKSCRAVHFKGSKTGGSNPGDFYLIDGKLYYVKTPNSNKIGQSIEEVIASRLYRAAGIDAPNEHYIYNEKGEIIGMASEYIPDMEARQWGSVSDAEAKLMYESFAVDAWLANWDAPKNDNTQVYENGKIIKSDVGGSLHYRARGEIKEDFNGIVFELLTLIENNNILYSRMTKQDVLNSINRVLKIPNETIYQTIMESPSHDIKLAEIMIRRKAYLQKFYDNLQKLDDNGQNVVDLIIEAQGMTTSDFREIPDIAGAFGYIPTDNGFEGLLNTQGAEKLQLTPELQSIADKMKAEIERFTIHNRLADNANVPDEVRTFVNGILQGIPEFASYFGKPQHGNGSVDSNGKATGHQYSLDIHILNVLQKSVNNPLYDKVDEYGFKLLDDESKLVLKFSALLHDIGKMHLNGKDEGHAERSAEYVYSILDRFNLPTRVKNRIINVVNNHHWFEKLCTGVINEATVAGIFRTTADFTIARIIAEADLESVYEGYFTSRMSRNFPSEVSNEKSAHKKFENMMNSIQAKVSQIEETSVAITPSKFIEIPEHVGSDGKIVPRRGFPIVEIELDGKVEQFRILNLNNLDPNTDMYQFGFNHIKLKDLRLLVHRFGDGQWGKFTTTKMLGDNPTRFSVQSLSLISPSKAAAYGGRNFSCIMENNNANIGVAIYRNAGTGTKKGLWDFVNELFDPSYEKKRTFFKNEFINYMKTKKGVELSSQEYAVIMRYVRNKEYPETQLKDFEKDGKIIKRPDLKIGNKTIKQSDILDAMLHSRDYLIEKQKHENYDEHNEETEIDCHVIAGGASLKSIEELKQTPEFLRLCRDNCNGTIILW